MGSRAKRGLGERNSLSATVSHSGLVINSSVTDEMGSDKAEQWSG